MTIGAAKIRVLENREQREQEAQSTMALVRQLIEAKDFDRAIAETGLLSGLYRAQAVELLKNAIPKPEEKCSECGEPLDFSFPDYWLKWQQGNCLNCEYLAVKKTLKDDCREIMQRRGMAKRFLDADLNDFSQSYKKIIKPDSGLYLTGPRGTGKTHLMAAMMKEEIINAEPLKTHSTGYDENIFHYDKPFERSFPLFISVPELLLKLRGTFNHSMTETSEQEILNIYSGVNVLYLDDLGTEKATDWALQTLYLLIDRRYSEMRRTIISSNLSLDELADHLDDRISSRIAGMCEVVKMTGEDRRLK
jgi:DNA replication protein DnaC